MKKKMLRVNIMAEGNSYQDLADAVEHAAHMLKLYAPSENSTFEDKSHVDFDVREIDESDSYADSCG